jgi:radical SAM superfamily enzyme YgiQ (UPF0313 family)
MSVRQPATFVAAMPDIVLATLNARYIHASFGLRYLLANLGELRPRAILAEFTINERPLDIAERILRLEPRIVGLGVYVWNVTPSTELVALLKRLRPELVVVLGGPEVSHETAAQEIVRLADHTICGEGDLAFAELCRRVFARPAAGEAASIPKIAVAPLPDLARIALPYDEYAETDIAHRLIYVEASRGCPFECEFCLSALDETVRAFPIEPFLAAMDRLLARGVRHFKFVDRTFNLHLATSRRILEFFLARLELHPGLFLHFEMVPDRFPAELRELVARFPAGSLQLEVGVQTFNPAVAEAIHRRQDYAKLEDNLRFLSAHTRAHVHADLIVGLPGETLESIAAGFDRLLALGPQEIQVGMLKRLRGAPIARHGEPEAMVHSPEPPYEILQNRTLDFPTMQRLRRFARYWDLVGNSGRFAATLPLLWAGAASPFAEFLRFSDWLHEKEGRQHGIALPRLVELVFAFLVEVRRLEPAAAATALDADGRRAGFGELPPAVRNFLAGASGPSVPRAPHGLARRQARYRGGASDRDHGNPNTPPRY